jgi:phosphoribosylformylglycinamidine synthase
VKVTVLIRPKEGILDPQGKAVERALPALGFEGVGHVRVGRLVELETDDPAALPELCEKLLANPLIEDFEVLPADSEAGQRERSPSTVGEARDPESAGSEAN